MEINVTLTPFGCSDPFWLLAGSGLSISVARSNILPKYLSANASFQSNDALATQVLDFAASPDVSCKLKNGSTQGTQSTLSVNRSDVLQCTREKDDTRSAVQIFSTSKPNDRGQARLIYRKQCYPAPFGLQIC